MHPGHALVALILIPLLTAAVLVFVPSERKDWVRIIAVLSGAVLFVISVYVFIAYKSGSSTGWRFALSYTWLHNVAVLGNNGIPFHGCVDVIQPVKVLLNDVVT